MTTMTALQWPALSAVSGKRLLIVDDNAASREAVKDLAGAKASVGCVVADDGVRALSALCEALARGESLEAAVIDAGMPNFDGIALGRAIKSDPALAGMGLILMVSLARPADADSARAAGFSAVVTKPVREADLMRALL